MRATVVICCILAFSLLGSLYAPEATLELSVTEVDKGVMITNMSSVACIVFVNSPEGEQRFELVVGENVTVTDVSQPIEVSAASQ